MTRHARTPHSARAHPTPHTTLFLNYLAIINSGLCAAQYVNQPSTAMAYTAPRVPRPNPVQTEAESFWGAVAFHSLGPSCAPPPQMRADSSGSTGAAAPLAVAPSGLAALAAASAAVAERSGEGGRAGTWGGGR
jgi:hypothetical protein